MSEASEEEIPISAAANSDAAGQESHTRKRRDKSKNGNRAQPKYKTEPANINSSSNRRRSGITRWIAMLLLWSLNLVAGSSERPLESFGDAWVRVFVTPAISLFQRFFNNLPRVHNRTALISGSAVIAIGIFLLLIFLGGAFSESVTVPVNSVREFPRHSNPSYEVNMLNASGIYSGYTTVIGNHNPFKLCWLIDSGASCHLRNDPHLFVNLKPCNVKISTAKSGESIMATGVGNVCINTWNELGHPVTITLNNVYFVKEARRNLLSVRCLSKQRYQTVLPSDAPIFPPGIYDGRQGNRSEKNRIPIECVDGLYFIKTSASPVDGNFSDYNPWISWQRKLGFMPLPAILSLVSRSVGLEGLEDAPFPKNFVG